ncbi:hypothetical protein EAO70_01280 [Streptomyces sp. adm13(2018)]|uniref:hypothetical protein n=1 Tax=Streptomyces sp. adm13(2018) TaxID=2479007 RepID=UPI0011CDD022|nr:hypothetical protein [Streptomyces sp. adm13(2018)]TXS31849.1 hypothetical protein EAO70_01280 [Streptomyces sp. adm13(2018)]
MDSGLIALGAAVVGVAGTLLATVVSQRMLARVQAAQFDREQRNAHTQWQRDQELTDLSRRRACYTAANAAYRRYRIALMNFLWAVHRSQATAADRAAVEEARSGHHTAFAEAQMIASAGVLAELDLMTKVIARAHAHTMRLADGIPEPDGSFEQIHEELVMITRRWVGMRDAMRSDLGLSPSLDGAGPDPADCLPPATASGPGAAPVPASVPGPVLRGVMGPVRGGGTG